MCVGPPFALNQMTGAGGNDTIRTMGDVVDLLERRVYSFSQIDHILNLPARTASRWIDGYIRDGKQYAPVVRLEPSGDQAATWGEFVECRLLSEYRNAGVPMHRMRPAVERLREVTQTRYPLASAKLWLDVEGRELVARVQEQVGLESQLSLVVIRTGQLSFDWSKQARHFQASLDWSSDDEDAVPTRIFPDHSNHLVEIDPRRGFGDPVIAGRGVRTDIIAELVRAGDPVDMIAELYDLERAQVEAAVRYELQRASA